MWRYFIKMFLYVWYFNTFFILMHLYPEFCPLWGIGGVPHEVFLPGAHLTQKVKNVTCQTALSIRVSLLQYFLFISLKCLPRNCQSVSWDICTVVGKLRCRFSPIWAEMLPVNFASYFFSLECWRFTFISPPFLLKRSKNKEIRLGVWQIHFKMEHFTVSLFEWRPPSSGRHVKINYSVVRTFMIRRREGLFALVFFNIYNLSQSLKGGI